MKVLNIILIVLLALLSSAAGLAKVMGSPQEVTFLLEFGFSRGGVTAYGIFQIVGAVLFALPKTLKVGALIISLGFALSSLLIFISGNLMFGVASLMPILLTLLVLRLSVRFKLQDI